MGAVPGAVAHPPTPAETSPVARSPQVTQVRTLVLIAVLAALAVVGRMAFLWAPNYALTYFVVFFAGILLGPLAGAVVGLVAMTTTNLVLSGLHPVLVANALAMAMLGLAGGLLRTWFLVSANSRSGRLLRVGVAGAVGLFGTFLFSVLGDLIGFFIQFMVTPEGALIGTSALVPMLLMGLLFNVGPAIVNMVLFATATPVLLSMLRRSGHLWPARVIDEGTARGSGIAGRTPAPAAATTRPGRP